MADEKKMTEVQALDAVLEGNITEEVLDKIQHMRDTRAKKRERKADDSKKLANIALGEQFLADWTEETFKASDVAKALDISTSKANAIAKACGWECVPTTEKVKVYRA